MKNIILVDTSYTNFHRFYATLRWYSFANKEEYKENIKDNKDYDFTKDKIFIEKYEKMYIESLKKLVGNKVFSFICKNFLRIRLYLYVKEIYLC